MFAHLVPRGGVVGEVVKPLGSGASQEEVVHWGGTWGSLSWLHILLILVFFPWDTTPVVSPLLPTSCLSDQDGLNPFGTVSQKQPSLPSVSCSVIPFYYSNRKGNSICIQIKIEVSDPINESMYRWVCNWNDFWEVMAPKLEDGVEKSSTLGIPFQGAVSAFSVCLSVHLPITYLSSVYLLIFHLSVIYLHLPFIYHPSM